MNHKLKGILLPKISRNLSLILTLYVLILMGPIACYHDGNVGGDTEEPASVCGNKIVEEGEQCDDGNDFGGDDCDIDCQKIVCGDGDVNLDAGEECDPAVEIGSDAYKGACSAECKLVLPHCGNGAYEPELGEQCDDGNIENDDYCDVYCQVDLCGNGITDENLGEQCDDGNDEDYDACGNDCQRNYCGDGEVNPKTYYDFNTNSYVTEECDDGNFFSFDGCSTQCEKEYCGNGKVDLKSEVCDDGNQSDDDSCLSTCQIAFVCGNGTWEPEIGEQCDDGNYSNGDGCDYECQLESTVIPQ